MRDCQSGEPVRICIGEEVGPYVIVPAEQAERVHATFHRHSVPHQLYPTVSNALTIIYLLGNNAMEYAQALLDALP